MTSPFGVGERPIDDLTARARIRDAALIQFAEKGVNGATLKCIANQAGVSVGLVQHHFGTKDNLRRACDDAVIEVFRRRTARGAVTGEITQPDFIADLYKATPPLINYLRPAAVEGGPAAAEVLDELTAGAEDFLTATWPQRFPRGSRRVRDAAAVMCAMHTGVIMLHDHLARQMRSDLCGADAARTGLAMADLYTAIGEFMAAPTGRQIADTVSEYRDNREATDAGRP
ncbi:TetR/AcrR family transcriptional regulator [Mycolicibacterium goodii]|uniref:TetR/AcrR family transcriptional regulator n=1 Tax=Mycolicibacterium goodii TaxID=134601 RepID=UPI0023AA6369|nr:TetR/AcrR family transcriptional regulator [Mycolicibacterium goodii]